MDAANIREFRTAIAGPPERVDVLGAALIIAGLGGRPVDGASVRRELDAIAEAACRHAGEATDIDRLSQAIDFQLFTVLGFHGSAEEYARPEHSFIDQVLARRTGLPILLSLVYMEVGRRAGLKCAGVGFPGHFIVRVGDREAGVFVDPFHQGARLDEAELRARLAGMNLRGARPETYLAPVTGRQILQRMLNNLRSAYRQRRDVRRWRETLELALCLEPWNAQLVGERGMLSYRLGDLGSALVDLERYVGATDRAAVASGALRLLGELRSRLQGEELR